MVGNWFRVFENQKLQNKKIPNILVLVYDGDPSRIKTMLISFTSDQLLVVDCWCLVVKHRRGSWSFEVGLPGTFCFADLFVPNGNSFDGFFNLGHRRGGCLMGFISWRSGESKRRIWVSSPLMRGSQKGALFFDQKQKSII